MCMYGSLCVFMDRWPRRDLISGIFEVTLECPEDLSLSILVQRPHKELCLQKPARLKEKDEES